MLFNFKFNETENRLDGLVQKIPKFVEKCQSFCDTSKDINTYRRINSLTLTRNAELLEVLEMPQLMESCLRSSQYNEALELSQYARQLGTKHGDIPIISVNYNIFTKRNKIYFILFINDLVDSGRN